ncbi:hypothetical protein SpCBS45565_g04229 [Spizellomyces sp. 'palustris']|nr:hypothetical protein SpCBS45565_g04229 [Spizellomyces sp. 'palustris']
MLVETPADAYDRTCDGSTVHDATHMNWKRANSLITPPDSRRPSQVHFKTQDKQDSSPEQLVESVSSFSYFIDHDNLLEGVATVIAHFFPAWIVSRDVKFIQCTAGITNKLVRCLHQPTGESALVRCYGKGSDILIDRRQEMLNLIALSRLGLSPALYGRFHNGLVYGYVEGVQFSVEDMQHPRKSLLVATQLARWHRVDLPGEPRVPKLFSTLWRWLDAATYSNSSADRKFKTSLNMDDLKEDLRQLQIVLEKLNSPVTFCHNDLLSGNIVYDQTRDSVAFIDYEYGNYSYRGFDIGNHFCEHAGFDCDWSLYPTKSFQLGWLREYIQSFTGSDAVSADEVEALYKEVAKFSLASHFYWAVWALVQAEISDLDFDYLEYALMRLREYRRRRDEVLAL